MIPMEVGRCHAAASYCSKRAATHNPGNPGLGSGGRRGGGHKGPVPPSPVK